MELERISCCSIPLHARPVDEALAIIREAGFKKVDLLGRMPHFDINDPTYDFPGVVSRAEKLGLRIANIGSYCGAGFSSPDPAVQEEAIADTRRVIDAAALCGARSIRTRAGHPEDPAFIDRVVDCYRRVAEYAEAKGVYMGVENHGGAISGNPELLAELFERVGSRYAGVLYEPCNLALAGVDYRAALDTLRPYVVHVHLKDCYPVQGKMRTVWLGTGMIDFRWVIGELERAGYDGDYALEYELDVEPPESALPKWLDWFLHV